MLKVNHKGKSVLQWNKVVDSAKKEAFSTGSQRDSQEGKGRYDLIPTSMMHRLAQHYENGALKYGDNNWQKGQPLAQYYNSAIRHLNAIKDADLEEDHFAAAIWNVAAMIHHIDAMFNGTLSRDLDSFGIVDKLIKLEQDQEFAEYQPPVNTNHQWIRTIVSGVYDDNLPLPYAYDRDRFKEKDIKTFKTVKLDPEELG